MSARYYDVVVLGTRLGALACSALLARRGFRVLVLGHDARPATYRHDGVPLRRRAFAHLAAQSPAWRRVVAELAQSQAFRRKLRPLDPMVQILDARRRFDLTPDPTVLARELDREFPAARASIEEMYAQLGRLDARLDGVFERDAVWPPGTFWERRETAKLRTMLPAPDAGELTVDAGYRGVVELTARFATNLAMGSGYSMPALPMARLHSAWARAFSDVAGDEDELSAAIVERIRAHGGEVQPSARCDGILLKSGRVAGVYVDGDDEETGCAFVIGDRPAPRLLTLVRDLEIDPGESFGSTVVRRRFVVSIVVRRALVPAPLGRHAFLVPKRPEGVEVHLQRATFAQEDAGLAALDAELWVAETIVDENASARARRGALSGGTRDEVLATLRDHFPSLDRHALVIDSPNDGRAILDARTGTRRIDRAEARGGGASVEAEPGEPFFRREPTSYAGLAGEPIRTVVPNLLSVSTAVLPALGAEGELLAAWGAARIVTRTDRTKEKMRREMWSKIEI